LSNLIHNLMGWSCETLPVLRSRNGAPRCPCNVAGPARASNGLSRGIIKHADQGQIVRETNFEDKFEWVKPKEQTGMSELGTTRTQIIGAKVYRSILTQFQTM
jgi:hypothetical protein